MQKDEIIERLDEEIGVSAFYIGKAFRLSRYEIDDLREIVKIWSVGGKIIDVKFSDMEEFFDNYSPVYPSKEKKITMVHNEEDTFIIPERPSYLRDELEVHEQTESEDDSILTDDELKDYAEPNDRLQREIKHSDRKNGERTEKDVTLFESKEDITCTINDMRNILMRTIKKVQSNRDYIQQANAINQSVNTLINLAKLSLQLIQKKRDGD